MTVSAIVLGEAPGYWPLTTTVGGTISGYSLIGSTGMASSPATVIRMASNLANIRLSMKNDEIFIAPRPQPDAGAAEVVPSVPIVTRCGVTVTPGCARCAPFTTITCPGFKPSRTMRKPSIASEFHLAILDLVVGAEQQHVLLVLIGIDRAVLDQDGRILAAHQQLHPCEQAGCELSVLVLKNRP